MNQQLQDSQRERDLFCDRLHSAEQALSAAENARDESVARIADLEQSLLNRDECLRQDAERRSQHLQQVQAVLTAFHTDDGCEMDSDADIVAGVRHLARTLQEKNSVC